MGASQDLSNQNQSITTYDYSKLFSTNFKVITGTYTNSSGDTVDLVEGMLFGRAHASGLLAILASGSSDGSQIPLGINLTAASVANGASATIRLAVTGRVNEDKLVFDGTDTLDTVVDNRRLRDRIPADTAGIELESFTELVNYENQ
jgi:hypothetical protein